MSTDLMLLAQLKKSNNKAVSGIAAFMSGCLKAADLEAELALMTLARTAGGLAREQRDRLTTALVLDGKIAPKDGSNDE